MGVLAISAFTTSCSDDEEVEVPSMTSIEKSFNNIKKLKSSFARRNAYNTLSENEKMEFWKTRLDTFLEKNNLNSKQTSTINEIKSLLKPEYFIKNSIQNKGFGIIILNKIIKHLQPDFSENQIYSLLFEIDSVDEIIKKQEETVKRVATRGNLKECICSVGSRYTCGRLVGASVLTVAATMEFGECSEGASCGESSWGCGGMWTQSCNGSNCSNF